jgi:hypothetical protein
MASGAQNDGEFLILRQDLPRRRDDVVRSNLGFLPFSTERMNIGFAFNSSANRTDFLMSHLTPTQSMKG